MEAFIATSSVRVGDPSTNIEAMAPALGPGFVLANAGSLTSNRAEVVGGTTSIKGAYSGTATSAAYLQTDPSDIPLVANHSYVVTFQCKILTPSSTGFDALYYSPTASAQGNFIPIPAAPNRRRRIHRVQETEC